LRCGAGAQAVTAKETNGTTRNKHPLSCSFRQEGLMCVSINHLSVQTKEMIMKKNTFVKILFLMLISIVLSVPALAQGVNQRPTGKAKGVSSTKRLPVPKDWTYMYDSKKGYGFYLPTGSVYNSETAKLKETTNIFTAITPAPSEVVVIVLAYKNKKLTKDDLLDDAVDYLEGMGETVEAGNLTAESEDYALADAVITDSLFRRKAKVRILVGTDITDNYVMIVGTDASKFEANKNIIDAIWGSFEMWSGGASGIN
jgi:hypothetical protein